ncbi:hypothetical protein [Kibdelosporangium phytohabitans]|uniref:Uncharacterized protein n=1 Tax=Kibdelosporangium phytohabitans TaxID=860235 RepID=A0A0N9I4E7_9PSEU|nr:hypothetical protein [Kibdelosporangium phytohabitans]ALG09225.1 hypothetical protein AOZ06_21990 [Kibdelosporangium phytohabitans]MBE1469539.1 hypothetical protein [Kibdelosporangium phytohabitans]
MDDNQRLTHGLEQLADEAEPRPVDVPSVIGKAKAQQKNRRAVLGVGGATAVVLAGALFTTVQVSETLPVVPGVRPTSSTQGTQPQPPNRQQVLPIVDARSQKLDSQLVAAKAQLIPAEFTAGDNPANPIQHPLRFSGSPGPKGEVNYTAQALLTNAQGTATFQIWVLKNQPGTELGHYYGQHFGPCAQGESNCVRRTLPDGTVAAARPDSRPPGLTLSSVMSAQRPDGTYIQVVTNVGERTSPKPLAIPPFDAEQLFKFATAFTW